MNILDLPGDDILKLWRLTGQTQRKLAEAYGVSRDELHSKISNAQQKELRQTGRQILGVDNEASDVASDIKDEQITREQSDNDLTLESKSPRIKTLDQLLEACEVDLKVWTVDNYIVNKWEVGAKNADKEIIVTPLFQVKAHLTKLVPDPIHPVIHPVIIQLAELDKPTPRTGLQCTVSLPDPQFGFLRNQRTGRLTPIHDPAALDVALQIVEELKPDRVVWMGDLLDLSGWNDKYLREAEFYFTTQPALNAGSGWVRRFDQHTAESIVMDGNHESRLKKALLIHLLAAYDLRTADNLDAPILGIDNLLGLTRMGVKYCGGYPDNEVWINDTTKIVHGNVARGGQGATSRAVVNAANETTIFGHIHRIERATKTIRARRGYRTISTLSPGCLCHIDGRVPGASHNDQWQQGIAITWHDNKISSTEIVEIQSGQAIYGGKFYKARKGSEDHRVRAQAIAEVE